MNPSFRRQGVLAIVAFVGATWMAEPLHAQPAQNPRVVEFDPSTDHFVTLSNGQPAVARYDFEIYLAGASAPFYTMSLGKPAAESDGKIRYNFSSQVASWPLPGGVYEARVKAVGPDGQGRSDVSNTFAFGACAPVMSTANIDANWPGGTLALPVTVAGVCPWNASTTASWLTFAIGDGYGNGTVSVKVQANQTREPRAATISIGTSQTVVNQNEKPADFPLAPVGLKTIPK